LLFAFSSTPPVVHRDLKPANIFVDGQWNVKLGDFGLARAKLDSSKFTTFGGTPIYMAPELFTGGKNIVAVDIYSMGLIIYELFIGEIPYSQVDLPQLGLVMQIMSGALKPTFDFTTSQFPKSRPIPQDIQRIILNCTDPDLTKRPNAANLLVNLMSANWGL